MIKGHWFGLVAAICIIAVASSSVQAQTQESEYFSQTGYYVQGDFLCFYRSVINPTLLFGYPLTEQFTNKEGKTVQYFQRARFELHLEMPADQRVQLTTLGKSIYAPGKPLIVNNPLACRTFPQTGYAVCFAFLEFFDRNGGVEQFGYPISPFESHNNMIVQYFEKARFEWRPNQAEGQRVGLADLGRIYFDTIGEDPGFLRPVANGYFRIRSVLRLRVRAFPSKAVVLPNEEETIFILVQDQNLTPIGGLPGVAEIQLPDGQTITQIFLVNDEGIGKLPVMVRNLPNGCLVSIKIQVTYSNLRGETKTSFRVWY